MPRGLPFPVYWSAPTTSRPSRGATWLLMEFLSLTKYESRSNLSVGAVWKSYRTPRLICSVRVIFQLSFTYQPRKFLLNAASALYVTPLPPPVPSRKDANPTPVLGSAALGLGP